MKTILSLHAYVSYILVLFACAWIHLTLQYSTYNVIVKYAQNMYPHMKYTYMYLYAYIHHVYADACVCPSTSMYIYLYGYVCVEYV